MTNQYEEFAFLNGKIAGINEVIYTLMDAGLVEFTRADVYDLIEPLRREVYSRIAGDYK